MVFFYFHNTIQTIRTTIYIVGIHGVHLCSIHDRPEILRDPWQKSFLSYCLPFFKIIFGHQFIICKLTPKKVMSKRKVSNLHNLLGIWDRGHKTNVPVDLLSGLALLIQYVTYKLLSQTCLH